MIACDAHVHLWPQFDAERLLSCARDNLSRQSHDRGITPAASTMVLFLADTRRAEGFAAVRAIADAGQGLGRFQLQPTAEEGSLLATDPARPEERLVLIAGRQIVTSEKIEVLSLASSAVIEDGLDLAATVAEVRKRGGLAVLPWGVGKWLGKRGAIIEGYLAHAEPRGLYVGDNGGRPGLWPAPTLFAKAAVRGIGLLSGTDPLPRPGEEQRVGTCGAWIEGSCDEMEPALSLRALLTANGRNLTGFGKNSSLFSFLKTQIALRMAK